DRERVGAFDPAGRGVRALAERRRPDRRGRARRRPAGAGIAMGRLDELRDDIDRVDEVLVRLLNERARVACEIGRIKKDLGIEVYQPEREKQVLAHVRGIAAEGPLGPDAIARLFERSIEEAG